MKKLVKVHMLPTEDKSRIVDNHGSLTYFKVKPIDITKNTIPQHLYFTSDEDIKEDDWFIHANLHKIFKCCKNSGNTVWANNMEMGDMVSRCRKIVATTDKSLKIESELDAYYGNGIGGAKSLPQISQQDQEAYCKAGGFDEVYLEYEKYLTSGWVPTYNNPDNTSGDISSEIDYRLRLDSNNCVITSPVKESWNREEVKALLLKYWEESGGKNGIVMTNWIKENI